jgi:hypothetical protein
VIVSYLVSNANRRLSGLDREPFFSIRNTSPSNRQARQHDERAPKIAVG